MSRLLEYLRTRPAGVTALTAAREALRLSGPPDRLELIALDALRSLPGAVLGPDGLWRAAAPAPPRVVALAAVATGPRPPADLLLAIGAARVVENDAVRIEVSAMPRPLRPLPPDVATTRAALGAAEDERPLAELLPALAALLDGAIVVCFEDDLPAEFLRRTIEHAERPERPRDVVVLLTALRRSGLATVRDGFPEVARRFGVVAPEGEDAGLRARAIAEVFLRVRKRILEADTGDFVFASKDFGPETLDALPARPGVYLFLDDDDRVLYVGKAADLRRRVRSYFGRARHRRQKEDELLRRMHRIEWEETGSELSALLREAELIAEAAPPYNVQRDVRRRRPAAGDLVLFLPEERETDAGLLLVREGRPIERLKLDRFHPDLRVLRSALRRCLTDPRAPGPANETGAQILASWLAAKSDRQNLMDLSETKGVADAAVRIAAWLADPDLFAERIYRR